MEGGERGTDLMIKINTLIDEEYESAKAKSATYGELKETLEKIASGIAWSRMENAAEIAAYTGKRFRKALNEELGGLMLKQKPPKERGTDKESNKAVPYHAETIGIHFEPPKGEPGPSGPTSMTHFEMKDGCWTEEYAELDGLCIAILNFLNRHPELAAKVEITRDYMRSLLLS